MGKVGLFSLVLCHALVIYSTGAWAGDELKLGDNNLSVPTTGVKQATFSTSRTSIGPLEISVFPCHGLVSYILIAPNGTVLFNQTTSPEPTPIGPSSDKYYGNHGISQGSTSKTYSHSNAAAGTYTLNFTNEVPASEISNAAAIAEVDIYVRNSGNSPFPAFAAATKSNPNPGQLHLNATNSPGGSRTVTAYWTPVKSPSADNVEYCVFYHDQKAHSIFDVHSSHCAHIITPSSQRFSTSMLCVNGSNTKATVNVPTLTLHEFDLVAKIKSGPNAGKKTAYNGAILKGISSSSKICTSPLLMVFSLLAVLVKTF